MRLFTILSGGDAVDTTAFWPLDLRLKGNSGLIISAAYVLVICVAPSFRLLTGRIYTYANVNTLAFYLAPAFIHLFPPNKIK